MNPQKSSHLTILITLIFTFLITISLYYIKDIQSFSTAPLTISDNLVIRIIDGDTFELSTGEKVRLICIDTPETGEPGAQEATDFLTELILNKEVRLEKDISETDRYGRLLRYVWVNVSLEGGSESEQEVFVNRELVKEGYAEVFRYGDDVARCGEIEFG